MAEAHDRGDWETTQKFAHKIKGGAVYVGALRMNVACLYFERHGNSSQTELKEKLYQQMVGITRQTLVEITEWLVQKKGSEYRDSGG